MYKDDAIIFNYLFGYKILKDDKSGFPESALDKVINTLESKRIDYQIISKDYNPIIKYYGNLNTYHNILKKSLEFINIQSRILRVQEKINEITYVKILERIIEIIENELQ